MKRVQKDIEKFFKQKCFITEWQEERQNWGETLVVEKGEKKEIACRVCRTPKVAVGEGVLPKEVVYDAVLLFGKENVIKAGSKIEVEQEVGENLIFCSVGETVYYDNHNEIGLRREGVI